MSAGHHPVTPDWRYFVVRGRLWRISDPSLPASRREALVKELMDARRGIGSAKKAGDESSERVSRAVVDRVKRELGERGPVWWHDGAPDYNRHMVGNTPYAQWHSNLSSG